MKEHWSIIDCGDGMAIVIDANYNFVARAYGTDRSRLIAAAPELLEACKVMAKCGYRDKFGWIKCAPNDSDIELVFAAIERAEGKS